MAGDLTELLRTLPERLRTEFDLAAVEIRFLQAPNLRHVPVTNLIAAYG